MISLLNLCMSEDPAESEEARRTISQYNNDDFINSLIQCDVSEFLSNQKVFSLLLKAFIRERKQQLNLFFREFDESRFLSLFTELANKVVAISSIEIKSYPAALLIAVMITSNPARFEALHESMTPPLVCDDRESLLPRLLIFLCIFKCLGKTRIPVKMHQICLYAKETAVKIFTTETEDKTLLLLSSFIIKKIVKHWAEQLTMSECTDIFSSLPNILPSADINLYNEVYDLLSCIVKNCYSMIGSIRDNICEVFQNGLAAKNEFFPVTMHYWNIIAEFEETIVQTNEELHDDYQNLRRECLELSLQMLEMFISSTTPDQFDCEPFLYADSISSCFRINAEHSFSIIIDFIEQIRQNEATHCLSFSFIQSFVKNETTYQYMSTIKDDIIGFIASVHEDEISVNEANSILTNFPELFVGVDEATAIVEGMKENDESVASMILTSLINCFPKDLPDSPLFVIADDILSFVFSDLAPESRYEVLVAFIEHIQKDNESYLISIIDHIFETGDNLGGLSDAISALSFNEDQSRELFKRLFAIDQELLFSSDGILALSAAVKQAPSITDEELSALETITHDCLEMLDDIGSAIGVFVSRLFIKFGERVVSLSEDVFNHIIITLRQEHTFGIALLKSAADIIETVGPIEGTRNDFTQAIWDSFNSINQSLGSFIQYVGYAIMIIGSTYFVENTEEQSSYIEMLIKYLIAAQSETIEYDDMKQICNTCKVFAMHISTRQARQILKGTNCASLKEGLKYKKTHDICKESLDALKSV